MGKSILFIADEDRLKEQRRQQFLKTWCMSAFTLNNPFAGIYCQIDENITIPRTQAIGILSEKTAGDSSLMATLEN